MITLQLLKWSNTFSYGANNSINFTNSQLTQLVGKNGHGKSSVALILEEVLFNKNSKGIKKGDILNRNVKDKSYYIELTFTKDSDSYRIESKRGSAQTVKLFKNDTDISSHTATATYKQIEEIIGMDHKTFCQIVYQSNASSLEFLTSPDTARKKFLIELLNLGKYTLAGEVFKAAATELGKEVSAAQAKVDTITSWLNKYEKTDMTEKVLSAVPSMPDVEQVGALKQQLDSIESTNKRITQNNTYKMLEAKAKENILPIPEKPSESEEPYIKAKAEASSKQTAATAFIRKMNGLHGQCPTCLSQIDEVKIAALVAEQEQIIAETSTTQAEVTTKLNELRAAYAAWERANKAQQEWERYHQLIDPELPEELEKEDELVTRIAKIQKEVDTAKQAIAAIEAENAAATTHNSKIALIKGQIEEMRSDLDIWAGKLQVVTNRLNKLNTLVKTFSTTGLVAYKIENLVKDLEDLTNQYLSELSGGRFQISFQISGSDKLNVIITDNGTDIDIAALSGGEKARVNVATLLAIRKLMQSLSKSRINLLILDETVEALDAEGKEKLIEVLLGEESLNTILVSHGFSHPLLEKVFVVKSNNISTIES